MYDNGEELAVFGGHPLIQGTLQPFRSLGSEELAAVIRVMESGCLSGFLASPGPGFLGGPMVRDFEEAWADRFRVKHAISLNSATSALIAALGAARIGPGDEIIVPPYTMSATVMAPLIYGGIPVFVDIEPKYFCINALAVEAAITSRTKAILAVDLFGHPAPLRELRAIADRHHIVLIEDAAQAPLATEYGRYCGTVGDIGVFSLNYHKHIHTGEGGMCVTNDDGLAERIRLIRNHGESVVDSPNIDDLTNLVGFNFRMTELSAAIGIEQLRKLSTRVEHRIAVAERLTAATSDLDGIVPPAVRVGCSHAFYVWAASVDESCLGLSRSQLSQALAAEGLPHRVGYVKPLYLLPLFQRRIAIGAEGFPFSLGSPDYSPGLCPVAERLHDRSLLLLEICSYDMSDSDIQQVAGVVRRVHAGRNMLKERLGH